MSQKTHPICFRNGHFFENLDFLDQAYGNLYSSYLLHEQQQLLDFTTFFFNSFGVRLHSFRCVKTSAKVVHLIIKYSHLKKVTKFKKKTNFVQKRSYFYFESLVKGFLFGISKFVEKFSVQVSFFNLCKQKRRSFYMGNVASSFFSRRELAFFLKTLLVFKGGSFLLAKVVSKKLQQIRSKKGKKRQSQLARFVKLLFAYLLKHNRVSIRGIRFSIKGRLNGSLRKKKWVFSKGHISLHQIDTEIDFSFFPSQTIYGSFGLKVWINYGKK